MINTTIVAISMAATTTCPKVLDIPVGSMPAVWSRGPTVVGCSGMSAPRPGRAAGRVWLGTVVVVRLTEFRGLMEAQFGPSRAPSVAHDHIFSALDGRTADEALAAGVDPKAVWFAVCDAYDIPESLRYGLPD